MNNSILKYTEPLFRPPGEASSLIFQITNGCSWNKCAFCEMYTSKKFSIRDISECVKEIKKASAYYNFSKKFFLADGDALVLHNNKLIPVLKAINENFRRVQRISSYASPRNINMKSPEELKELKENGLSLVYIGIESGDNEVLNAINKGEDYGSICSAIHKIQEVGIDTSVMIINGLGGKEYRQQHAVSSAKLVNEVQPKFLSVLALSMPFGESQYKKRFKGDYIPLTQMELLKELKLFIKKTELDSTIFRSDHISNYLILKGILGRNKQDFLTDIESEIKRIDQTGDWTPDTRNKVL